MLYTVQSNSVLRNERGDRAPVDDLATDTETVQATYKVAKAII